MAKPRLRKASSHSSEPVTLILLNKPFGIVSQFSGDDRTLAELIKLPQVYPAGRLDKDSEGLLLLTNSGQLQHQISTPQFKMEKNYWVQVDGQITQSAIDQLLTGVNLKDGPAKAKRASCIKEPDNLWPRQPPIRVRQAIPTSWLNIVISEGRNRQVRRMTAAVGHPTLRLIRHRIGKWSIDNIPSGKFLTIKQNLNDFLA